jgi:ABC-type lipoprotein export system ATPase subunit
VTHDPEVASRADRKIVLRDGLIVEDSLPYSETVPGSREILVQNEDKNG